MEDFVGKSLPETRPLIESKAGIFLNRGSRPILLNFAALNGFTVFHSLQDKHRPTHFICSTPHWSQKKTSEGAFEGDFIPDREDIWKD